jgi:hypothetical protein
VDAKTFSINFDIMVNPCANAVFQTLPNPISEMNVAYTSA